MLCVADGLPSAVPASAQDNEMMTAFRPACMHLVVSSNSTAASPNAASRRQSLPAAGLGRTCTSTAAAPASSRGESAVECQCLNVDPAEHRCPMKRAPSRRGRRRRRRIGGGSKPEYHPQILGTPTPAGHRCRMKRAQRRRGRPRRRRTGRRRQRRGGWRRASGPKQGRRATRPPATSTCWTW